jgi:hypothetical protein
MHAHTPTSSFSAPVSQLVASCIVALLCQQALSEGREWQLLEPQLLTSKGYKLLQCCHTALEQLQKLLALKPSTVSNTTSSSNDSCSASAQDVLESAARQLMGAMCDGRLVPTPWLNEVRASMLSCLINQVSSRQFGCTPVDLAS